MKELQTQDLIIISKFLTYLQEKGRKQTTIRRYSYDIHFFMQYIRDCDTTFTPNIWATLEEKDYENYFSYLTNEKKWGASTINRTRIVLNTFTKFMRLEEEGPNIEHSLKSVAVKQRALHDQDFITTEEANMLWEIIPSLAHLSDIQIPAREKINPRNVIMYTLMLYYGFTLHEIADLQMDHIKFEKNIILIPTRKKGNTIRISDALKKYMFYYFKTIPEPVRPRYHSQDPFFVAFDFRRDTYRWLYDKDRPKRLTPIAIQKFVREEVKRAGLRKGICAQHFRNTFILNLFLQEENESSILQLGGMNTKAALRRYQRFVQNFKTALDDYKLPSLDEELEKLLPKKDEAL